MKVYLETPVIGNFREIREGFDLSLFERLKMPLTELYMRSFEGTEKGDEISFTMKVLGKSIYWEGLITENKETKEESYFIDIGKELPWPLESWIHKHSFVRVSDTETMIVDDVSFTCRSKFLEYLVQPALLGYFFYRSSIYKKVFA